MVRLQKYETELRAIWILFIPAPPFPQWRVGEGQVESGDRVEFDVRSFPPWPLVWQVARDPPARSACDAESYSLERTVSKERLTVGARIRKSDLRSLIVLAPLPLSGTRPSGE